MVIVPLLMIDVALVSSAMEKSPLVRIVPLLVIIEPVEKAS